MDSGNWFKTIISRKKTRKEKSRKSKGPANANGVSLLPTEDVAAVRIQTAFRGYKARRTLRCLKGIERLRSLTQNQYVKDQASKILNYVQSWSRMQAQISARRLCMVTESRIKQKKLDTQLKIEAKLHDLETEWSGGSETMDEIVARIKQREEAAVKRERAMAYAFSHQWRANTNQGPFVYEFGKGNWGWSWMDRWIAARPWEARIPSQSISLSKPMTKSMSKVDKAERKSNLAKSPASNGKKSTRRLSAPPTAEKPKNLEAESKARLSLPLQDNGMTTNQGPPASEVTI